MIQDAVVQNETDSTETKIGEAVGSYINVQLGIYPEVMTVDVHDQSVTVTLEGVSHPAEMSLAKEQVACSMIQKLYVELFTISKPVLHSRLSDILGRTVDRSFFTVDPFCGSAVIVLLLTDA